MSESVGHGKWPVVNGKVVVHGAKKCNAAAHYYTFLSGYGCIPSGLLSAWDAPSPDSACRRTHSMLGDGCLGHLSFVQWWASGPRSWEEPTAGMQMRDVSD